MYYICKQTTKPCITQPTQSMMHKITWHGCGPVYVPEEMNVDTTAEVVEELPEAFMTESEAIAAISECKSKDELTALYRGFSQSVRTLESVIAASKLKASEWN